MTPWYHIPAHWSLDPAKQALWRQMASGLYVPTPTVRKPPKEKSKKKTKTKAEIRRRMRFTSKPGDCVNVPVTWDLCDWAGRDWEKCKSQTYIRLLKTQYDIYLQEKRWDKNWDRRERRSRFGVDEDSQLQDGLEMLEEHA